MTDQKQDITSNDARKRHCPMLGHEIHFGYCRCPASELPCRKIFDCWFEIFDVEAFVRANYTAEQIQQVLAPRADKMVTLIELIEKARRANR